MDTCYLQPNILKFLWEFQRVNKKLLEISKVPSSSGVWLDDKN